MNKKCTKCGVEKDEVLFNKCSKNKSGYRAICKKCQSKQETEYYSKNKDKKKRYYFDNLERIKKQRKSSLKLKASQVAYNIKHRKRLTEYMREFREGKRDSYNEYMRLWNKKNINKVKNCRYMSKYGITFEDKFEMVKKQNYGCLICGIDLRTIKEQCVCVDHSHDTGKVRGILCHNCNSGLGKFKDNVSSLKNAIDYLLKNSEIT